MSDKSARVNVKLSQSARAVLDRCHCDQILAKDHGGHKPSVGEIVEAAVYVLSQVSPGKIKKLIREKPWEKGGVNE